MLRHRIQPGWLSVFRVSALVVSAAMVGAAVVWMDVVPKAKAGQVETPASPKPAPAAETFVAILGEIKQPGTYRIVGRQVSLQELVARAGGLTPGASTLVRRVRGGEPERSFAYKPDKKDELRNGDVIQVLRDAQRPAQPHHDKIRVALVGVLEEPVVMPFPAGKEEVVKLITQFGLPEDCARQTRVYGNSLRWDPGKGAVKPLGLENGSVVVFQPEIFATTELPMLAAPLEFDPKQPARTSSPIRLASARAKETPGRVALADAALPPTPMPAPVPTSTIVVPPLGLTPPVIPPLKPLEGAGKGIADPPAALPKVVPEPPARLAAAAPLKDPADLLDLESLDAAPAETSPIRMWHMLVILGVVAALVGAALYVRRLVGVPDPIRQGAASYSLGRRKSLIRQRLMQDEPESVESEMAVEAPVEAVAEPAPVVADLPKPKLPAPIVPVLAPVAVKLPPVVSPAPSKPAAPPPKPLLDEQTLRLKALLDDLMTMDEQPVELPTGLRLEGWLAPAPQVQMHRSHAAVPAPHAFGRVSRPGQERQQDRIDAFLDHARRPVKSPSAEPEDSAAVKATILERLRESTEQLTPLDRALQQLQGGTR